jgi:hypothetical protein
LVACLFLSSSQAQALKPRKVLFDSTCWANKTVVEVDKLWGIIQQMKANAQDVARSPVGKLYAHIFKEQSNAAFILSKYTIQHCGASF